MEENTHLEDIADHIKEYANTRYELLRLKAAEKVTNIGSSIGMAMFLSLFLILFLIFLSLSIGFYFTALLESYIYGFLAVAGIHFLILMIVYLGRKSIIINPLKNMLIREMFEEKDEEKDTNLK